MKRTTRAAVVALVMVAGVAPLVQAKQEPQSPSGAGPGRAQRGARAQAEASQAPVVDGNAGELRDQVHRLLDQYPPGVAEMLRIDPTLAMNDVYMAAYPGLRALVAQRPEIVQNGRYFFGLPDTAATRGSNRPTRARSAFERSGRCSAHCCCSLAS